MRKRPRLGFLSERGQSFAEFTLILPIALVLTLGVVDLGKAISYWLDSGHLANEAARYAAVDQCPQNVASPACTAAPDGSILDPNSYPPSIIAQAESPELQGRAHICIQDTSPAGDWSAGDTIKVTVFSVYPFLHFLGSFINVAKITVHGHSTMRLEKTWTHKPGTSSLGTCPPS
jgi:Flp pilus assembly protein TadG